MKHSETNDLRAVESELMLGGQTVTRLAAAIGSTPFYAYERDRITERVGELRAVLPADWHLHYAMKANPMPAVVQHLAGLVDGIDVASAREMRQALNAGMSAEHISMAGPGKSTEEISQAVASGIVLNIESVREMRVAAIESARLGLRARLAVRVNPDFEVKGTGMRMGGGAKQFGIDASAVPEVLTEMGTLPVEFVGFHIYSGSQILKAAALTEIQSNTIALARRLAKYAPGPVRKLNIGGGFGIPYFAGDKRLDLQAVGVHMHALREEIRSHFPQAVPIIELGRFLVGEAGVYICKVVDRKVSNGQVFLVTDGGLHHHLSASGNFGQFMRRNYPLAVATRFSAALEETVNVVGPLCTPLDLLGDKVQLPRADVGDLIAIFQSGAYGLTASPTRFLNHAAPAEVLV
jgi:diaminopimelate decarboxylase